MRMRMQRCSDSAAAQRRRPTCLEPRHALVESINENQLPVARITCNSGACGERSGDGESAAAGASTPRWQSGPVLTLIQWLRVHLSHRSVYRRTRGRAPRLGALAFSYLASRSRVVSRVAVITKPWPRVTPAAWSSSLWNTGDPLRSR